MIPRVKPEGMLFGKPDSTFPDHALDDTQIGRLRVQARFKPLQFRSPDAHPGPIAAA
jgi:hypothetical protein